MAAMTADHRSLAALAAAALLGLGMAGCGGTRPPEDPTPGRDVNPSVLERSEMDQTAITMEELLLGRLPGVEVRRVRGGLSVLIRGISSFSTSNEALIIIDGVQSSGVGLAGVNPEDVERVEVIKDGAAAFYGFRGANGVLIVTTRR
jgi:TonB-dependent SusC/RagA subfamily outer membrane receptor